LEKARETIWIRQVRSGIGFPRKQKSVLRCLGLRRLHQLEERPDTPQVRGLVAKVPHLVEIVNPSDLPRGDSPLPYTVQPPVVAPAETVITASTVVEAEEAVTAHEPGTAPGPTAEKTAKAPSKGVEVEKKQHAEKGKGKASKKTVASKAAEPKGKAAKPSRTAKK
jgi:large subunit ribosomal protein L30